MIIYNTLTGKKERISKRGKKKLFVCGPTVYDYPHIGHARTYISFDFIVKYLRSKGWKIFYLQNITDIDDKIIKRAKEQDKTWEEVAKKFTDIYYKDMESIGVNSVDKYAEASKYIPQIIKQVQTLTKKGIAYKIERDGYYFDISKFSDYGKLAKRTAEQAEDSVSRIDRGDKKRNKGDFCLWKFHREGEPYWKSPLGKGRPGWHIEDTAISEYYFGSQYDLHGGAQDLKFPHHEAEIAQQESASGKKPFVQTWMHTGTLTVEGKKMSKSLKNFITIREFLKNNSPELLRWFVLLHHYRKRVDFKKENLESASNSLKNIEDTIVKLDFVSKNQSKEIKTKLPIKKIVEETERAFDSAMEDDFNTPEAIASLFGLVNRINAGIWKISRKDSKKIKKFIKELLSFLGLEISPPNIPKEITSLSKEREKSRSNKQFIQADRLRGKIESLGYEIEDTPLGPLVRKN